MLVTAFRNPVWRKTPRRHPHDLHQQAQITFSISRDCFGLLIFKIFDNDFEKHLEANMWKAGDTADCKEDLRAPMKIKNGATIAMSLLSLVDLTLLKQ